MWRGRQPCSFSSGRWRCSASIASWLVQRVSATTETAVENAEQPVVAEITDLAAEVAALRREIAQLKDAQLKNAQLRSGRPS
jgi:cell division protein FtsB